MSKILPYPYMSKYFTQPHPLSEVLSNSWKSSLEASILNLANNLPPCIWHWMNFLSISPIFLMHSIFISGSFSYMFSYCIYFILTLYRKAVSIFIALIHLNTIAFVEDQLLDLKIKWIEEKDWDWYELILRECFGVLTLKKEA